MRLSLAPRLDAMVLAEDGAKPESSRRLARMMGDLAISGPD